MVLLDHVGIRVTDMERSIRFYSELFGLEVVQRFTRPDPEGRLIDTAALKVNDHSGIFLTMQPGLQPYAAEERPEHICLTFDPAEFQTVMERLTKADAFARLPSKLMPRSGMTGRSPSIDILDPDNNRIEIKNLGT
jgi:catechol 2,3-dioxygenase-like lactoylglutathione lyase family enzyme